MGVTVAEFGNTLKGEAVQRYTLENGSGLSVSVITYGARIIELMVPDRRGVPGDVVWGYDTIGEYCTPRDSQGAIIGRYAGRIRGASMTLEGKHYALADNANGNTLHGGTGTGACFSEKVWEVAEVKQSETPSLMLRLLSRDGEGGFPGNLEVFVTYSLTGDNQLDIRYLARCDQTTALNLTSHCFFNLNGYNGSSIHSQYLSVAADTYTEMAGDDVLSGRILPVSGTPLDFTRERLLGEGIGAFERGYNHNFVLNNGGAAYAQAACLYDPASGREMKVYSVQPGLQVYTAGGVKKGKKGKKGSEMYPFGSVCLETQHFPDSVHYPQFPSTVLHPGEVYASHTAYAFGTRDEG